MARLVAIDNDSPGHRPQIGPLTTRDEQSEMVMADIATDAEGVAAGKAIGAAVFHFDLIGHGLRRLQSLPGTPVRSVSVALLTELARHPLNSSVSKCA